MSGAVFHKHTRGELAGDDALAEALTSTSAITRIMARGAAADWLRPFAAWINDEINRPKAVPSEILQAIAVLQIQTISSIAAQLLSPDGDDEFLRVYLEIVDEHMTAHMQRTRKEAEGGWS